MESSVYMGRFHSLFPIIIFYFSLFSFSPLFAHKNPLPTHGIALHGDLKYGKDFKHFDYVNPSAPKGGTFIRYGIGTFDSLNPFIIKGSAAAGFSSLHPGEFYASLTKKSSDEPFSEYGYLAEKIELAEDKKSITYTLRNNAVFHDGSPIRVEDVIFTFEITREKGSPQYKSYYGDITKVEKVSDHQVRFHFKDNQNKELPLIIGQMPIISEAYYKGKDFEKPSLDIPLGNGPYKIAQVEAGRSITYERVANWWGNDLAINKGRYNFERLKFIYFRDAEVAFEGFKSGEYDYRFEFSAKNWAKNYDFPAFKKGEVIREEIEKSLYNGMTMLSFNIRREIFKDVKARKALSLLFDFEWTNKNVLYNMYKKRPLSYFEGETLGARGKPTQAELKILEPYKSQLPPEVYTSEFALPMTKGDGNIRPLIKEAINLLQQAGYAIKEGKMINQRTGKQLQFEILFVDPSTEKLLQGFVKNLSEIGVKALLKNTESAQYIQKVNNFDYDMVADMSLQSDSPGNEQREMWGSQAASQPGSRNLIGIKNKVVDELIEKLIEAQTREDLLNHVKALDRVLMWEYYVVPLFHHDYTRLAYWKKMKRPPVMPLYDPDMDTWWIDQESELKMTSAQNSSVNEKEDENAAKNENASAKIFSPTRIALIVILLLAALFIIRKNYYKRRNRD